MLGRELLRARLQPVEIGAEGGDAERGDRRTLEEGVMGTASGAQGLTALLLAPRMDGREQPLHVDEQLRLDGALGLVIDIGIHPFEHLVDRGLLLLGEHLEEGSLLTQSVHKPDEDATGHATSLDEPLVGIGIHSAWRGQVERALQNIDRGRIGIVAQIVHPIGAVQVVARAGYRLDVGEGTLVALHGCAQLVGERPERQGRTVVTLRSVGTLDQLGDRDRDRAGADHGAGRIGQLLRLRGRLLQLSVGLLLASLLVVTSLQMRHDHLLHVVACEGLTRALLTLDEGLQQQGVLVLAIVEVIDPYASGHAAEAGDSREKGRHLEGCGCVVHQLTDHHGLILVLRQLVLRSLHLVGLLLVAFGSRGKALGALLRGK